MQTSRIKSYNWNNQQCQCCSDVQTDNSSYTSNQHLCCLFIQSSRSTMLTSTDVAATPTVGKKAVVVSSVVSVTTWNDVTNWGGELKQRKRLIRGKKSGTSLSLCKHYTSFLQANPASCWQHKHTKNRNSSFPVVSAGNGREKNAQMFVHMRHSTMELLGARCTLCCWRETEKRAYAQTLTRCTLKRDETMIKLR